MFESKNKSRDNNVDDDDNGNDQFPSDYFF